MHTDDSVMYHYCSSNAFTQIVSTKTLWLTDMFATNDREEHRWLRKIAAEVIEAERKQPSRAWDEPTMRLLKKMVVDCSEIGDIYLACFSRQGDSLGQWRAYADDGHGVAIGFSREFILAKQREMGQRYLEVLEVEYQADRQKELVLSALVAAEEQRRHAAGVLTEAEGDTCDGSFRNVFIGKIWDYAARCKHQSFAEEQEVRVVLYPIWDDIDEDRKLKLGYRPTRGAVTRYFELPIGNSGQPPIKRIVLGPKNTSRLSHVKEFLHENGIDICEDAISRSDVPYR